MGWPLNGDWDRATTPPGASLADMGIICESICRGWRERWNLARNPSLGILFYYTDSLSDQKQIPLESDFTSTPFYRGLVSNISPIAYNAYLSASYNASGTGIQGVIDWYQDAACTIPYTVAEINEDSFNAIGLPYPYLGNYIYNGKYDDGVLATTDANLFLLAKEVMNRCIYTIISGTPTDCRPLLTDQI